MNIDDIKQRYEPKEAKIFNKNNSVLRTEIEEQTKEFLRKKGKITQLESCLSSHLIDFKSNLSQQANAGLKNKTK